MIYEFFTHIFSKLRDGEIFGFILAKLWALCQVVMQI